MIKTAMTFAIGTCFGCWVALYGIVPRWIIEGRKRYDQRFWE